MGDIQQIPPAVALALLAGRVEAAAAGRCRKTHDAEAASEDVAQELAAIRAEVAALRVELNRGPQTTQHESNIGRVYLESAKRLNQAAALPTLKAEQVTAVRQAVSRLLQEWSSAGAHELHMSNDQQSRQGRNAKTLNDAVKAKAGGGAVLEAEHMQPLAMQLIHALGRAVNTELCIVDTHNKQPLGGQGGAIHCSLLWRPVRAWPYLVCPFEFKLTDMDAAVGKLISRCRSLFDQQPARTFTFAIGMTCSTLQLLKVQRLAESALLVEATDVLELEHQQQLSAQAQGVSVLAQVLAARCDDHDYKEPVMPVEQTVHGRKLSGYQLVRLSSNQARGATVYRAKWQQQCDGSSAQGVMFDGSAGDSSPGSDSMEDEPGDDDCMIKVGVTDKEVKLLQQAQGAAHCVQLKGVFHFKDSEQMCVILQPCCAVFSTAPGLEKLAKLGSDVAAGIGELYKVKIYHRDISRNNIGFYKNDGYLFDLSGGKDFGDDPDQLQLETGQPVRFAGTPLYAAVCVMEGRPHSVSSDLESLYYSLRHIAYGELPDQLVFHPHNPSTTWALARRGACNATQSFPSSEYADMMLELHQLFWPKGKYWYDEVEDNHKTHVMVGDFQDVCKKFTNP